MPKIVVVSIDHKPELRKIQIRNRGDGKPRYIANLPSKFFDRLISKYKGKEGTHRIKCIDIIINEGTLYLEFDKTADGIY